MGFDGGGHACASGLTCAGIGGAAAEPLAEPWRCVPHRDDVDSSCGDAGRCHGGEFHCRVHPCDPLLDPQQCSGAQSAKGYALRARLA